MSVDIRDVLNRRNDLSTFVVHLTRDGEAPAADNLRSIITNQALRARSPMGWAWDQDGAVAEAQSQRVVCFSETPIEHIHSLAADIAGRTVKLRPYGLALTKLAARRMGVNPVWYVDMTPGRDWTIKKAIDHLKAQAVSTGDFHNQPAAAVLPFVEQMGTWESAAGTRKEFWWEREWRHQGDLPLRFENVALWLAPEDEHEMFEEAIIDAQRAAGVRPDDLCEPYFVDPRWGVESIIANLVGHGGDVTPFGPH